MPIGVNTTQRSLPLTDDAWERLDEIAAENGCIVTAGRTIGQPSWRVLLREIAEGKLVVSRVDGNDDGEGEDG